MTYNLSNMWAMSIIDTSVINTSLKPLHNIGKTEKPTFPQIYTYLTWYKDNDGRKLSLKFFCMMCYRFRIISEIQINAECIFTVFS